MDEMGHPLRVVGVIADIGEEKRRSEFLQNRAERDGLTGFYNQTAGKLRAQQLLEKQGVYYRLWNQLPGEDTL